MNREKGPRLIGIKDALRTLKNSEQVSYIVDSSMALVYHNEAWDRFAQENSAPELAGEPAIGISLLDVTHESLKPFYSAAFKKVTRESVVWEWVYECSSPERFRKFLMRVHPIEPDGWFLVTNNILVEEDHAGGPGGPLMDYVDAAGQIRVCVHCRCSKRTAAPERWDFVPANLKREVENVTHGLCPICKGYFYPSLTK